MKAVTQMFIGTTDEWESKNPRLYDAVWGIEELSNGRRLLKIGNGKNLWNDLEYVDETYINGLGGHFNQVMAAVIDNANRIDAIEGKGGYLDPYDFGTPVPTQEALTAYALEQIGITNPLEIYSSTRVKNLFNGHLWRLINTTTVQPPIFEWKDDGFETVGEATNVTLGVVKGSLDDDKASINDAGEIIPHGYLLNKKDYGNGVIEERILESDGGLWRMTDNNDETENVRAFNAETGNPIKIEEYVRDKTSHIGTRSFATKTGRYYTKGKSDASFGPDDEYATLADIKESMDPPGTIKECFIRDPFILSKKRWLVLRGDVIPIIGYEELVENTYVGDALNETSDWFYKTQDAEGTIRDVDGGYFVLPDPQGLFIRIAGQNSKYLMANDTPYDGKAIGAYLADQIQGHWFTDLYIGDTLITWAQAVASGSTWNVAINSGQTGYNMRTMTADGTNGAPRVGSETRPASISSYLCIKY